MEVFLQINFEVAKMVPLLLHDKTRPNPHKAISFKVNRISCRASTELSVPRKKTNLYEVLSLGSENVGFDEIKQAYRRMARRYHPDVCPPSAKEESTKRFVEIREAYETLSDPISRQMHDHEFSLANSNGFGVEGFRIGERENRFPRAAWEMQLNELRRRSRLRMERKR